MSRPRTRPTSAFFSSRRSTATLRSPISLRFTTSACSPRSPALPRNPSRPTRLPPTPRRRHCGRRSASHRQRHASATAATANARGVASPSQRRHRADSPRGRRRQQAAGRRQRGDVARSHRLVCVGVRERRAPRARGVARAEQEVAHRQDRCAQGRAVRRQGSRAARLPSGDCADDQRCDAGDARRRCSKRC
jgi:hypothetical protein